MACRLLVLAGALLSCWTEDKKESLSLNFFTATFTDRWPEPIPSRIVRREFKGQQNRGNRTESL